MNCHADPIGIHHLQALGRGVTVLLPALPAERSPLHKPGLAVRSTIFQRPPAAGRAFVCQAHTCV